MKKEKLCAPRGTHKAFLGEAFNEMLNGILRFKNSIPNPFIFQNFLNLIIYLFS